MIRTNFEVTTSDKKIKIKWEGKFEYFQMKVRQWKSKSFSWRDPRKQNKLKVTIKENKVTVLFYLLSAVQNFKSGVIGWMWKVTELHHAELCHTQFDAEFVTFTGAGMQIMMMDYWDVFFHLLSTFYFKPRTILTGCLETSRILVHQSLTKDISLAKILGFNVNIVILTEHIPHNAILAYVGFNCCVAFYRMKKKEWCFCISNGILQVTNLWMSLSCSNINTLDLKE